MKIEDKESAVHVSSLLKKQQGKEVSPKMPEKNGSPQDEVQLSPQARDFQRIKDVLKKTPEVRQEKVAELSQRINSGNYDVDNEKVAEKIIRDNLIDLFI